jgi:hypothetical protein
MPKWTRIVAPINRMIEPKILFEGEYSKVLEPDCHFIVLKKDFLRIKEVFRKNQRS